LKYVGCSGRDANVVYSASVAAAAAAAAVIAIRQTEYPSVLLLRKGEIGIQKPFLRLPPVHNLDVELQSMEQSGVILSRLDRAEVNDDFGAEISLQEVVEEYEAMLLLDGDEVVTVAVVFGGWDECQLGIDALDELFSVAIG
jgi:hypothetical protein